ncbi:ankyrin repeat-containing protein [Gossypium australe]|uniref:Ankyrin repeat-containing protein n=1 Tax=Gossypium australe TaxID=47621 RepID=A0A5B6WKE7_9ROSI|nr:ankyrin repeat-containing protein [Gossypium australe]
MQRMVKLLLNCKENKHATNQHSSAALGVAQKHNSKESITILHGCFIPVISNFNYKMEKLIVNLLLTATYQASLSPPGGIWQGNSSSNSIVIKRIEERELPGSIRTSVMGQSYFFLFYIQNYIVFIVTFFLMLSLLKPFPYGFKTSLQVLLALRPTCFDQSISFITPTFLTTKILRIFRVSKLSVSIVGYWLLPVNSYGKLRISTVEYTNMY